MAAGAPRRRARGARGGGPVRAPATFTGPPSHFRVGVCACRPLELPPLPLDAPRGSFRSSAMVAAASPLTLVDACLVRCFVGLQEELERCGCVLGPAEATSSDVPLVRWRLPNDDELLPHAALVFAGSEIVARTEAGESLSGIVAALPRTTLVVVGPPPPKLERVLTSVQLECGVSVRRVLNVAELAELLAALGVATGRAASRSDETEVAFLSGLTSRDVLHNQKVPRGPSDAWLGVLKQILPERSALVLHESYPTVCSIYKHYREVDDPQGARCA